MDINLFIFRNLFNVFTIGVLGLYVYYKKPRNLTNRAFFFYALFAALWCFSDYNLIVTNRYQLARFWGYGYAVIPLEAISLLVLIIAFTENKAYLKNKLKRALIFLPGILFSTLMIIDNCLYPSIQKTDGIWTKTIGSSFFSQLINYSMGLWGVIVMTAIFYMIILFLNKTKDPLKRKQIRVVIFGGVIAILANILETLSWYLGTSVPKLSFLGLPIFTAFLAYAIVKYEMFKINPVSAAISIVETMTDSLLLLDTQYRVMSINPSTSNLINLEKNNILGKKIDTFLYLESGKKFTGKKLENKLKKKGYIKDFELYIKTVSKDKIPVSLSASKVSSKGTFRGVVCILRDISERKKVETAKTAFVSLVSHELKVPLTSIKWNSELLISDDYKEDKQKREKMLRSIHRTSNKMVNLVNTFLNISRIEMGKFNVSPEPIDLAETTRKVLEKIKPSYKKKKFQVKTDFPDEIPKINLDKNLIEIAVQNLISNAFKYTPKKGKITVQLEKKNEKVLLVVEDNGYGIPKKQQDEIFSMMFRAENVRKKDIGGTGLGLYITKTIVKLANGKIWFESEENKGTTFYISIPTSGMEKKKGTRELIKTK